MDGTKLTLGTVAALAMAAAARGRKGERNVNAVEQLQTSFHTRSNRQDFPEFYPQTAAGTLEVFRSDKLHKGEKVAWAGTPGRMLPVDRRYVHPISGNIFDQDKFSAITEQVKARERWGRPPCVPSWVRPGDADRAHRHCRVHRIRRRRLGATLHHRRRGDGRLPGEP